MARPSPPRPSPSAASLVYSASPWSSSRLLGLAITGNLVTIILALIPAYTFVQPVLKEGSVGNRMVYAHLIGFFNSVMWMLYASTNLPSRHLLFVVSGLGIGIQFCYINFYIYHADRKKGTQALLLFCAFIVAAFLIAEVVLSMVATHRWRSTFIDVMASASGASVHIFPIFDMVMVIKCKHINNMNPFTPLISLFGASTWTAYGFISTPINLYIVVPNLIGIVSTALQILVYLIYRKTGVSSAEVDVVEPSSKRKESPESFV